MKYADRIRQASSPQDAMLIIAEGIDEVLDEVLAPRPESADGWGSWGSGGPQPGGAAAPQPDYQQGFYDKKVSAVDHEGIERAQSAIARYEALPPTPHNQAMLDQAQHALAVASKPGEYLDHSGDIVGDDYIVVENGPDGVIVDLPPASPERQAQRRRLAEAIDLPGFFPPLWRDEPNASELIEAYVRGGPTWLYANRITDDEHDIFTALPHQAKVVMVADLHEDSPKLAWEFQRDVLKGEDVEGSTLAIAEDNIQRGAERAHVPLRSPG